VTKRRLKLEEKPPTRRVTEAAKRQLNAEKMQEQIMAWSTRLDGFVAGYLESGAQPHDTYRLGIDDLRTRHRAVQRKMNDYMETNPSGERGTWGAFQEAIKEDWTALEEGFKDLTH